MTIANADMIDSRKRHCLDSLRSVLNSAHSSRERFNSLRDLFTEYRSYSMDTLLIISRQCLNEAQKIDNDTLIYESYIMMSEAYKGIGEYNAALQTLDKIPEPWRTFFRQRIYNRYCSIYYSLVEHSSNPDDLAENSSRLENYRDSIISVSQPGSTDYWLNKANLRKSHNDLSGALASIDSIEYSSGPPIDPGVLAYNKATCHESLGDIELAKLYYAIAADYDLRHSVRKYEALQELARLLSYEGDDQRSFKYIMRAITDIRNSHATSRIQRISSYLPIISNAYTDARQKSSRHKNLLLLFSVLSSVALCCATLYAINKNRRLNQERRDLRRKNDELEDLRSRLSEVNSQLKESAKIKEEYLGYLFNLCADYIASNDKYRLHLRNLIKAGKMKDVDTLLSSPVGSDHLSSFFKKFDSIFLDIFPDFIEKFNTLMKPGCEIHPRKDELLTPELRIYALVRLGINDSTQIAAFLRYSPQTVYNYRFRVRSNSNIPKEDFPKAVRAL